MLIRSPGALLKDIAFMELAIQEAIQAAGQGELPIGAVVAKEGVILARNRNRSIGDRDPTAHAEILALREAASKLGNYRMPGCELYVTVEPCPMCVGAIVHSRVQRLIFGTRSDRTGAVYSVFPLLNAPQFNHRVEVTEGVLASRCRELLVRFFQECRAGGEVPKWS